MFFIIFDKWNINYQINSNYKIMYQFQILPVHFCHNSIPIVELMVHFSEPECPFPNYCENWLLMAYKFPHSLENCLWQNRSCPTWEVLPTLGKPRARVWLNKFLVPLPQGGINFVLQFMQFRLHLRPHPCIALHCVIPLSLCKYFLLRENTWWICALQSLSRSLFLGNWI